MTPQDVISGEAVYYSNAVWPSTVIASCCNSSLSPLCFISIRRCLPVSPGRSRPTRGSWPDLWLEPQRKLPSIPWRWAQVYPCVFVVCLLAATLKVPPASLLSPRDAFQKLIHPPRWHAEIDFLSHRLEERQDEEAQNRERRGHLNFCFCFTFVKVKDRNMKPTGVNVLEEFRNYRTKTNKTQVWCFIDLFSWRLYQWL